MKGIFILRNEPICFINCLVSTESSHERSIEWVTVEGVWMKLLNGPLRRLRTSQFGLYNP